MGGPGTPAQRKMASTAAGASTAGATIATDTWAAILVSVYHSFINIFKTKTMVVLFRYI